MTCLKLLIRLKMEEEAELKSPECPTDVALVLRMMSNGSVECSAVAQHCVFGLCLTLKSKAKFQLTFMMEGQSLYITVSVVHIYECNYWWYGSSILLEVCLAS